LYNLIYIKHLCAFEFKLKKEMGDALAWSTKEILPIPEV
jgi:hypothetical protein